MHFTGVPVHRGDLILALPPPLAVASRSCRRGAGQQGSSSAGEGERRQVPGGSRGEAGGGRCNDEFPAEAYILLFPVNNKVGHGPDGVVGGGRGFIGRLGSPLHSALQTPLPPRVQAPPQQQPTA